MERIGALIHRLLEQYESHADNNTLLLTAQMLLNELQQANKNAAIEGKKVAIILPSAKRVEIEEKYLPEEPKPQSSKQDIPAANIVKEKTVEKVFDEEATPFAFEEKRIPVKETRTSQHYNIDDIPTFAYQKKNAADLNEAMAGDAESLNDRLKTERPELGSILKEAPVRDLRKAIGINDRFVFINELFRGDENMYERSIKTINSFTALGEAEFWIQRELKTKIGWNESNETVQHFDQLVRRRFSAT
jgi:hypothetical protein